MNRKRKEVGLLLEIYKVGEGACNFIDNPRKPQHTA